MWEGGLRTQVLKLSENVLFPFLGSLLKPLTNHCFLWLLVRKCNVIAFTKHVAKHLLILRTHVLCSQNTMYFLVIHWFSF